MRKVRIGVCTSDEGGTVPWIFFWLNIRIAGGSPFRITPEKPASIEALDGLIVAGGADIAPDLYGKDNYSKKITEQAKQAVKEKFWMKEMMSLALGVGTYILRRIFGLTHAPAEAAKRDQLEAPLINKAVKRGVPVLGVCRGMQLLNVVMGGTLHQEIADIYEDVSHPYTVLPYKTIMVHKKSLLERLVGKSKIRVNAMHHQAVNKVAAGLSVVAEDKHGIIEAIEFQNNCFAIGVQWHPEFLLLSKSQRNIFRGLVMAAQNKQSMID